MSNATYSKNIGKRRLPLVWLHGEVRSPPFSAEARIEAGVLLRQLQEGVNLSLPHSRPMPVIGRACHEIRIQDEKRTWRIVYFLDVSAVVVLDVFAKTTGQTPKSVVEVCKARLRRYKSIKHGVMA